MTGHFRWKSIIAIFGTLCVLGVGLFFLHRYQMKRLNLRFKDHAERAIESGNPDRAMRFYKLYLSMRRDDNDARAKFADLLGTAPGGEWSALKVYEEILKADPKKENVQKKAGELSLLAAYLDGTPKQLEKIDNAIDHFKKYCEAKPSDAEARLMLGLAYREKSRSRSLAAQPNAQKAIADNVANARREMQEAIRSKPSLIDAHVFLSELLRKTDGTSRKAKESENSKNQEEANKTEEKNAEQARDALDKMIDQNPKEFRAYLERASFLMGLQTEASLAQAAKDLEKARELKPNKKEEFLLSAQFAMLSPRNAKAPGANEKTLKAEREKLDKARAILKKAAELYPTDDVVLSALARMEWAAGNPKQAIDLQRSAKKHATKTEIGEFASLLDQLLHRYTEKFATKVRRQEIAVFLASMLIVDSQYAEAKEVLDEAESLGVKRSRLNVMRGEIEYRQGNWRAAAEAFDFARPELSAELLKADEQKRKDIMTLLLQSELLLSEALKNLDDRNGQILALTRAKKLAPLNIAVRKQLVDSYMRAMRFDEANEEGREISRLTNDDTSEVVVELNSAFRNAMSRPKEKQAWEPFNRALARFTEKSLPVFSLEVMALTAQGEFDQARGLLKSMNKLEAKDEAYRRNLMAEVEFSSGKTADAFKILDDAIKEKVKPTPVLILAKLNFLTRAEKPSASSILAMESEIPLAETSDQASLYQSLGLTMNALKDTKNAERLLRKALELEPNSLPIHLVVLDFFWRKRDLKSIDGIVSAIGKIDGKDSPWALYGQSLSLITKARPNPLSDESKRALAEAKRLLTAASVKRPTEPKFPEAMAVIASPSLEDDRPSMFGHLEKAAKLGSRDPEVRSAYLSQLLYLNRMAEAADYIESLPRSDLTPGLKQFGALTSVQTDRNDRAPNDLHLDAFDPDSKNPSDHVFRGMYLRAKGKTDEARNAFEKANKLAPTQPWPLILLVDLLAKENKIEDAKKAVESLSGSIAPEARVMTLATCYRYLKQPDNVKAILAKELQRNGSNLETLVSAKQLYLEIGELQKAEELLQRILKHEKAQEPLKAQARRELVRVAWQQAKVNNLTDAMTQRHREALEMVEKNLKDNPNSEEDRYEKAMLLAVRPESRAEAIEILEKIYVSRNPTPEQVYTLAEIYDLEGNWNKARDNYLKFARTGSRSERYPFLLPAVVHKLIAHDEMPAAEEVIGRLIKEITRQKKIEPQPPEMLRLSTATLHVRGEFELKRGNAAAIENLFREQLGKKDLDAKAQTERYLAFGGILTDLARHFPEHHEKIQNHGKSVLDDALPKDADPLVALVTAEFLAACGAVDPALDICEKSVGKAEPAQVGRVAIAAVCGNPKAKAPAEQRKRVERVDRMLSSFQTANPKSVEIKTLKAVFDEQQERYEDAEKGYQALIDQNPANVVAANNLAVLLALRGRSAEAIKLIDPFIEQYRVGRLRDNGELLDSRAIILLKAGDLKRAEQDIRESVAQSRDSGRLFHMAQIYAAMGNTSRSRSIFLEAQRLGLRPENLHPLELARYFELAGTRQ